MDVHKPVVAAVNGPVAGIGFGFMLAWAEDVAAHCSPRSLATIKKQVYEDPGLPREHALQRAVELMRRSFDWPDLAEAVRARSEKRPPAFPPLDTPGEPAFP